jgi:hypothetical protein
MSRVVRGNGLAQYQVDWWWYRMVGRENACYEETTTLETSSGRKNPTWKPRHDG